MNIGTKTPFYTESGNRKETTEDASTLRVVVAYKTFGPYHVASLQHLAKWAYQENIWFEGVALAGRQNEYPWIETEGDQLAFRSTTLFPGETLQNVPTLRLIRKLFVYIRKTKPNVFFSSNYVSIPMALMTILTLLQGGKAVIISPSTRLDHPRNAIKEKLKRLLLLPYSKAFVSGERASEYIQSLGIDKKNIVKGCCIVDNDTIARHVEKSKKDQCQMEARKLLCVARLIPKKNLFFLIDAYTLYRTEYASQHPLKLVICGSGPLEGALRAYACQSNAHDIEFPGFIQQPDLYSLLARATVLVLPSTSEQWGRVVNEAMAAGLPVLVSEKCGCVPELVQPGKTGWSFDPEDTGTIAELIGKVEKLTEEEYQRMAAAAHQLIADWDLDRFTNGVLTLTKRLAH
jgi:glycosyltransferase involved in cell wall biosynthesis